MVDTIAGAAGNGYAGEATDLAQFLDRFHAAAWEVAGQCFADETDRAIAALSR